MPLPNLEMASMVASHLHEFEAFVIETKDMKSMMAAGMLRAKNIIQWKILSKRSSHVPDANYIIVFSQFLLRVKETGDA